MVQKVSEWRTEWDWACREGAVAEEAHKRLMSGSYQTMVSHQTCVFSFDASTLTLWLP